jgi:hypothetical protein
MVALADNYNFHAGVSSVDREIDDGYSAAFAFEGAYYFGGIDDSKGPLAEALLIDRASSLSVVYGVSEIFPSDEDITITGIGGRYVGKDSGLIIDVNYPSNQIAGSR